MRTLLLVPGIAVVLTMAAVAVAGPVGAAPTTTRLSSSGTGLPANGFSELPGLSDDCRFATFTSEGSNLVPEANNFIGDVFVKDRRSGALDKVSVSSTGQLAGCNFCTASGIGGPCAALANTYRT